MQTNNGATPRLLLTAREAATSLAISERTLYSISDPRGPLPVVRLGKGLVRYSPTALAAWIDGQASQSRDRANCGGSSEESSR